MQFAASLYGTDDDPMDTVIMRDGVYHGAHHAADSMGQVRVNFMGLDDDVVEGQDQSGTVDTPPSVLDWMLVGGSPFGEWPLTIRATGAGYKLRIRIAGSVSATVATATFRVIIGPPSVTELGGITDPVDSTFEATFTTTAATWETSGASQGSVASATLLTISADQVRQWIRDVGIWDKVSSPADGHTVEQCLVSAHVYAKTSDVTKLPQLNTLHIQEFLG